MDLIKRELLWAEIRIYDDIINLAIQHGLSKHSFTDAMRQLKQLTEKDVVDLEMAELTK